VTFISPRNVNGTYTYLGDIVSSDLSLAVWLSDAYTQDKPLGRFNVNIQQGNIKPIINISGFYLFNNLPPATYTVDIASEWYFPLQHTVDTSTLDPKDPAINLELIPNPSYPFGTYATLARAIVESANGPVADATVLVVAKPIATVTNSEGEFVLYFKGIKTESINIEITKDGDTKTVAATIEEGKTVSLGVIGFP
jgi:hypothetical protein